MIMLKIKDKLTDLFLKVLFTLMSLCPIFDFLGDYIVYKDLYLIHGQSLRFLFIVIFICLILANFNCGILKRNIFISAIVTLLCIIYILIVYIFKNEYYNNSLLLITLNFVCCIYIVEGVRLLIKLNVISQEFIKSILDINSFLIIGIILITRIFGIGFYKYIDTTSLNNYYSSYHVFGFVLVLLLFVKYKELLNNKSIIKMISVILILTCCFLLKSTISLVSCVLILIFLPIHIRNRSNARVCNNIIILTLFILFIAICFLIVLINESVIMIEKININALLFFLNGYMVFYINYLILAVAYTLSKKKTNKIMLVSSTGGHYEQLKQLFYLKDKYEVVLLTEKNVLNNVKLDIKVHFLYQQERKNLKFIIIFLINVLNAFYYICLERPKVIISTGAGCSVFPCIFTKLFGGKIIYIESFAKVDSRTKSGKLIYKISDTFYVQWEEMLRLYPEAVYKGGIYR